jgi:hypothetical protein
VATPKEAVRYFFVGTALGAAFVVVGLVVVTWPLAVVLLTNPK